MKIVIHDGLFHADDLFSIAIMKIIYKNFDLIRTRDEKEFENADFVIDVGRKFDNIKYFDHHQVVGVGARVDGFPYASFGLLWKKFGEQLCGSKGAADFLDEKFVKHIDSRDTGHGERGTLESLYETLLTMNTRWNEEDQNQDNAFNKALEIVIHILERQITNAKSEFFAKEKILDLLSKRETPEILIMEDHIPWKETILENAPEVLYVVFKGKDTNNWCVQATPKSENSFDLKKPFPISWAGKIKEDLAKETGISDSVFCHASKFIAVVETKDSAIKLAKIALKA